MTKLGTNCIKRRERGLFHRFILMYKWIGTCLLFVCITHPIFTQNELTTIQKQEKVLLQRYAHQKDLNNLFELVDLLLLDSKYQDALTFLDGYSEVQMTERELGLYYLARAKTYKYLNKNDLALKFFILSRGKLMNTKHRWEYFLFGVEFLEYHRKMNNTKEALIYVKRLKDMIDKKEIIDPVLINHFYHRYAAFANERLSADGAINLSHQALEIAKNNNLYIAMAISYNELGYSYKNRLVFDSCIFYYEHAVDLFLKTGCYREAVHAENNLIDFLSHNSRRPRKVIIAMYKGLIEKIDQYQVDFSKSGPYNRIEIEYIGLNDYKNAHKYRRLHDEASDRENRKQIEIALNELKEKYQNEQLELRNKSISKLAKIRREKLLQARNEFWLIVLFSVVVSILCVGLYYYWRKNYRKNKLLLTQNIQKTRLIQEVHHRVKNNLQFVRSILSMQESLNELSASQTIIDISRRIDAMSIVHEMLYTEDEEMEIAVKQYIERLIEVSSNIYLLDKRIKFDVEVVDVTMPLDRLIALGMICSELLANSVKHVFVYAEEPIFYIKFTSDQENFQLYVKDNGQENIVEAEEKRHNLGMRLIEIFARQLEGTYEINAQNGYEFKLIFPKTPA